MKQNVIGKINLILITILTCLIFVYLLINLDFKYFSYVLSLRIPKLIAIIISATCISSASIIFQAITNNRIITPSLLAMDVLYVFIHTVSYFILTSTNSFILNSNYSFILDLVLITLIGTYTYNFLFQKTNFNIIYVLLCGSVLSSFLNSIISTLTRMMDPNEYDVLLSELVPGFDNINESIFVVSIIILLILAKITWADLQKLDVVALGKPHAINLGVDYNKLVNKLLKVVIILMGISTALVGPLTFLGLIVINITYELIPSNQHRYLMPAAIIIGIIILLGAQILVEHVFGFGTQVSVVINILGGCYFLYLIKKEHR